MRIVYDATMSAVVDEHASPGPRKPGLFMSAAAGLRPTIIPPRRCTPADLATGHTDDYVRDFIEGSGLAESSGLRWTASVRDAALSCVGALRSAIEDALSTGTSCVAPVAGFHHAVPTSGMHFCALSGQAIASVSVHRTLGAVGAYLDLDAHHGNSIDDTYAFQPELLKAVPRGMNVNPHGYDPRGYTRRAVAGAKRLALARPDYVVLCHGADTISGDPMGAGLLTRDQWVQLGADVAATLRGIPMVYCLFGGYADDAVLGQLHVDGATAAVSAHRPA